MNIIILGCGHMGTWLAEELSQNQRVAVYDKKPENMKYLFKAERMEELSEIEEFEPDILINAVDLPHTIEAFEEASEYLPEDCIISDIASVKQKMADYYKSIDRPFVSTHPMFGPTFADIKNLDKENAIIIEESDEKGKKFFRNFYKNLGLKIFEYSFDEHDQKTAYSLGVPFTASLVFAACLNDQEAPGTTFRKHMEIAKGLLSEDDYLLSEILFNPKVLPQIKKINTKLSYLTHIIKSKENEVLEDFLDELRDNIGPTES